MRGLANIKYSSIIVSLCIFLYTLYTDINECSESTDGCQQMCMNTIGSFSCACNRGYRLAGNGHRCDGMCVLYKLLISS